MKKNEEDNMSKIVRLDYFAFEILRKVYVKFFGPDLSKDGQLEINKVKEFWVHSEEQEVIKNWLEGDKPCFLGRLGSIELNCYNNWQQVIASRLVKDIVFGGDIG